MNCLTPFSPEDLVAQIHESAQGIQALENQLDAIADAARLLVHTLQSGGRVFTAGNGGSAAEAMHMSEELVGRFRADRRSLPAVALCADGTALTCIANDFGFDQVFSRQVLGLGAAGDLLVLFSTSGRGRNLDEAVNAARSLELRILLVLGRDGGSLAGRGDVEIRVDGSRTERIQEAHQVVMHLLLDRVERVFLPESERIASAETGGVCHE